MSLNRRTGLLRALGARYATFYFSDFTIMMDLLRYGSDQIYSFMLPRSTGHKPVEDFRHLSNRLGTLWWSEKGRTNKRYLAATRVLDQAHANGAAVDSIYPEVFLIPSVKARNLIRLQLDPAALTADNLAHDSLAQRIKQAYRRQAMIHHPDLGGQGETFIKIQEAYENLIQWAKRPTFIHHTGFPDKWLYEGRRNRWLAPNRPAKKH